MADEALRMQAEVVDKFTGPLKSFRQHLLDVTRSGADHSETLTKGFGKVEGALQNTARTAQTVLNPALGALGVTGLGVGVAVAGIAGALRNLSGNLTALGQLSRETGVAADTLRVFGSVAAKFNVDQDSMAAGTKNFVANLREFRMHGNETFAWLQSQGRTTEGRSAFQSLAKDLRNSTDAGEALKKALQFGEQIKDPTERGIFFQKLFGNADLARVADGHLGKLEDVWKKTTERLPPLDPKAILKAEEFERAVADLRGSMKSIGTTIASEVLPFASDFTKWIDDIVKDQRGDFMKGLREGLKEVSAELRGVDWKSAGDGAKEMLVGTTALVGTLAKGLKDVADTVRFLREGEYWQALRQEGGNGALARKLAPRLGDDEIAAQEEVDKARKLRDAAKEAGEHLIGRTQQRMGLLVDPEKAQRDLDAAEARLKGLKERAPEDRKRDFDASEKLRRSMDGLTDELKAQRQNKDAQVSKSSAEGDGAFGGARIQSAAFGGGGGYRRYGGGSGPGYAGEAGPAGPGAGRSYGGGRFNGLGGGSGGGTRMPGIGGEAAGSAPSEPPSGYSGNDGRRAARSGMTAAGRQNVNSWMEFFRRSVDQGGMGYTEEQARGQIAMMQGESGLNLNPAAKGDKDGAGTPHAFGTVQWSDAKGNQRFPRLRALAAEMGKDWTDRGVQQEMYRREMTGAYRGVYNRIRGSKTGEQSLWSGITGYENPREHSLAYSIRRPFLDRLRRDGSHGGSAGESEGDFLPNGTPRVLKPDSMRGAPGLTRSESDRMRAGKADGDAWAAREKARREFDQRLQSGDERLTASASRAGVGGGKLEANGSVYVQVHRPGPETQVSTSASGNLFRDVQMRRGQAMEKAGGG